MSDFLDRLAARAIGSESAGGGSALAPRLPSLFEPLQRAPIMPLPDDGETPPRQQETVLAASVTPTTTPMRPPYAPTAAAVNTSRVPAAAPEAKPAPTPARAAASPPRDAMRPSARTDVPAPPSIAEHTAVPPAPTEVFVPLPVRPRETRIAVEQRESVAPPHPAHGALLPASTPVFGATRAGDAADRPAHASALRTPAAPTGHGHAASEPVVHVSIGRIEVRAAPPSATPPRRRDGPQPSSLDDYLRQRGKASP
jgi:hypothetical protein